MEQNQIEIRFLSLNIFYIMQIWNVFSFQILDIWLVGRFDAIQYPDDS